MSIRITKPGVLATLQDAGRWGYRDIGIGSGGAMDVFAVQIANFLCGNDDHGAVLEINFPAPEIVFQEDAVIALAGADFNAVMNGIELPSWSAIMIKKNSVLKFNQPVSGARLYLAVKGGWQAEKWLNSYSTHLKLAIGGHHGRALQKDDQLSFKPTRFSIAENKLLPWQISPHELDKIYQPSNRLCCIRGVEYDLLDESSMKNFERFEFTISHQSDRMGYRLKGQPFFLQHPVELISSPVDSGTIQLLPDGNCIILGSDHQTIGGYPRIASVIKADQPKLAQANPGQLVNFRLISLQQAEEQYMKMNEVLEAIKVSCHHHLKKYTAA